MTNHTARIAAGDKSFQQQEEEEEEGVTLQLYVNEAEACWENNRTHQHMSADGTAGVHKHIPPFHTLNMKTHQFCFFTGCRPLSGRTVDLSCF